MSTSLLEREHLDSYSFYLVQGMQLLLKEGVRSQTDLLHSPPDIHYPGATCGGQETGQSSVGRELRKCF